MVLGFSVHKDARFTCPSTTYDLVSSLGFAPDYRFGVVATSYKPKGENLFGGYHLEQSYLTIKGAGIVGLWIFVEKLNGFVLFDRATESFSPVEIDEKGTMIRQRMEEELDSFISWLILV